MAKGGSGTSPTAEDTPPPLPAKKRTASQSNQDEALLSVTAGAGAPSPRALSPLGSSPSPYDTTPLSLSPTSSISSALSAASSEDLLSDSRTEKAQSQSSSQATTPTLSSVGQTERLSMYDNFHVLLPSGQDSQLFSDFAKRMNELTSNIHSKGSVLEQFSAQMGKDLPTLSGQEGVVRRTFLTTNKVDRGQVRSQYDNMFEQGDVQTDGPGVMKRTVMKTSYSAHGFSSVSSSSSACTATSLLNSGAPSATAMYSKTMQVNASQETFSSSSETCSSSGVGTASMESLQRPPPLPPKKRAGTEFTRA